MFCPNCGTQLPDGAGFCSNCGFSLSGAPAASAAPAQGGGFLSFEIMKRAFRVILKKPFKLWGLSLLCGLLELLAYIFGGPVLAIGLVISLVLTLGMEWIYLDGFRGEEVDSKQLFEPFKNFWRSFAGMGWRELWILIWSMIPFAGIVFGVIKSYAYQLTPFIMREDAEIGAQDALKESIRRTNGYKGKMFVADLLIVLILCAPSLVLSLFGLIPFVGIVFTILNCLYSMVIAIFGPLYSGLVRAAWYEEITGAQE